MRINHCFVAGNSFEYGNNGKVQMRKSSIHFIFGTFLTSLKKVEESINNYYMPGIKIQSIVCVTYSAIPYTGNTLDVSFCSKQSLRKERWGSIIYNKTLPIVSCFQLNNDFKNEHLIHVCEIPMLLKFTILDIQSPFLNFSNCQYLTIEYMLFCCFVLF